jgi:hypothetical protein
VRAACAAYSLALARQPPGMKAGFAAYLRARPRVRAVLVGTRRSDPHGASLSHFDPTDHGWPSFMRVHPVIDWHYVDVWTVRRLGRLGTGADCGVVYTPAQDSVLPAVRPRLHVARRHDGHAPQPGAAARERD